MQTDELQIWHSRTESEIEKMKLCQITISPTTFARLSEFERLLFFRISHVHDDLRYIRQLVVISHNGAKVFAGVEREVARHQLLFAIKLWCGALAEAVSTINTTGNAEAATALYNAIPSVARQAGKTFRRYFSKTNLIETIRDRFAFHYDIQPLRETMRDGLDLQDFTAVLGDRDMDTRFNVFYTFAEQFRGAALLRLIGNEDFVGAVDGLVREITRVHEWFIIYSEELLAAILHKCAPSVTDVTSTAVIDPQKALPIVFVDEEAIMKGLRNRGAKM